MISRIKDKFILLWLVIMLVIPLNITQSYGASTNMVLDSVTVRDSGIVKLIGHISGLTAGRSAQVTLLVFEGEEVTASNQIAYINQTGTTGNNGTFAYEFRLDQKWSNKTLTVKFGSDANASAKTTITTHVIPPRLANIVSNSVIYGVDAYYLRDNKDLNAETVADSIVTGGNVIYYKVDDYWYDLMDERCTSAAFLTKENAVSYTFMQTVPLRYYYIDGKKLTFATE